MSGIQKENSVFFCIPEREYLRAIGSKLVQTERNAKEKLVFLLHLHMHETIFLPTKKGRTEITEIRKIFVEDYYFWP